MFLCDIRDLEEANFAVDKDDTSLIIDDFKWFLILGLIFAVHVSYKKAHIGT